MRLARIATIVILSAAAAHAQVGAPGTSAGGPAAGNVVSPGGKGARGGPGLEPAPRPPKTDPPPVGAAGEPPLDPAGPAPGVPRTDEDAGVADTLEADPGLGTGGTFDDLGTGDGGTFDDLGTEDDEELAP